jgi:hypothetical protein
MAEASAKYNLGGIKLAAAAKDFAVLRNASGRKAAEYGDGDMKTEAWRVRECRKYQAWHHGSGSMEKRRDLCANHAWNLAKHLYVSRQILR